MVFVDDPRHSVFHDEAAHPALATRRQYRDGSEVSFDGSAVVRITRSRVDDITMGSGNHHAGVRRKGLEAFELERRVLSLKRHALDTQRTVHGQLAGDVVQI